MSLESFGRLRARVVGGASTGGPTVVLMHGFGAPGDDLVPFAEVLMQTGALPPGTRFVFPEAPISFDMGFGESRAWWMIDLDRIQRAMLSGRVQDLTRDEPDGLAEARAAMTELLDALERRYQLAGAPLVIGGFSQGAMLACDLALSLDRPLAGLVLLSGTLLAEDRWAAAMPRRTGLAIFQSHGSFDPLLPFFLAERLRELFTGAGANVDFVAFPGGHEIPPPVLGGLVRWLGAQLGSAPRK